MGKRKRVLMSVGEDDTVTEWQVAEVKKALAEANRGEFASEQEVRRTMEKWTRKWPPES